MLKVFRTAFIKILLFSSLFASDPITFDSLFKKQLGLRMVTSFEYLSSGNADFYNTYPYISTYNDGKNYLDNRQFSLRQSFICSINDSLDIITNARLSYTQSDTQEGGFSLP
ncbi:nucleoid-structuring protein H-NS [uncultured Campylobacter sp.]|uniref:nucleoid-structuring protein H-NS n=1 Tax=uncultured Campylobacter sp. TaxID=218934 RepID=UPI00260232F3|nr:nucleoid-structuring protein H-NS [uncultured Campylobacter sp.]